MKYPEDHQPPGGKVEQYRRRLAEINDEIEAIEAELKNATMPSDPPRYTPDQLGEGTPAQD